MFSSYVLCSNEKILRPLFMRKKRLRSPVDGPGPGTNPSQLLSPPPLLQSGEYLPLVYHNPTPSAHTNNNHTIHETCTETNSSPLALKLFFLVPNSRSATYFGSKRWSNEKMINVYCNWVFDTVVTSSFAVEAKVVECNGWGQNF